MMPFRAFSRSILALTVATSASYTSALLTESLTGLGLLGNYFGVSSLNNTFDYVVVGGGTAGLAMATRLAEDGRYSVAVIEAGGFYELDNGNRTEIPAWDSYFAGTNPMFRNGLIDWEQQTQPMPGLGGRSIFYTTGKTFGGGSARNFLVYNRGTRGSYQMWADQVQDQSYTFDNLLPFFKKSTYFEPPDNSARPANATYNPPLTYWATNSTGPIHVSFFNWVNAIASWSQLGMRQLGLKDASDFVSGSLMGAQYSNAFVEKAAQTRSSSETGYLRLALQKGLNVVFYKSTLAKRILFDGTKAQGVQVETAGSSYTLSAKREVVVCAGAFRSPQLLMVSGVGPQDILKSFGIPVVRNLPGVGQNLQDQPIFGPSYAAKVTTHTELINSAAFLNSQTSAYNNNRTGILTNIGDDFIAFEKIPTSLRQSYSNYTRDSLAQYPADWPEVEWVISDGYAGPVSDLLLKNGPMDGRNYFTPIMALLAPFSRGNITISSRDTAVNPLVNLNFLGDTRDQEQAVAAYKRARQLLQTSAVKPVIDGTEAFPGLNYTTDDQILGVIKQTTATIWHASCTCKMGLQNDTMAVVDSHARVFGVQGLRVVDASIFPFLPPIHPTGTIYALAEKIASEILAGQ